MFRLNAHTDDVYIYIYIYIYILHLKCSPYICTVSYLKIQLVNCVLNVMAHAQKPDFVFRAKRISPFKLARVSVQSTTGSRGVRISGSNAGYTMFRGSVKSTGYHLHSPVSLSLPLPCGTVRHHISTGLYRGCCRGLKGPGVKLTTHLHLEPRLEMYGAINLLLMYAFMA